MPNTDFTGVDTYEYTICDDGVPPLCDEATVTITVTPTPPTAVNDLYTTPEDTPVTIDPLANDMPYNTTGDTLIIS